METGIKSSARRSTKEKRMKRSVISKVMETVLTCFGLGLVSYNAGFLVALGLLLFAWGNNLKFTPRD